MTKSPTELQRGPADEPPLAALCRLHEFIQRFGPSYYRYTRVVLGRPVCIDEIGGAERALGLILPPRYVDFVREHGPFAIVGPGALAEDEAEDDTERAEILVHAPGDAATDVSGAGLSKSFKQLHPTYYRLLTPRQIVEVKESWAVFDGTEASAFLQDAIPFQCNPYNTNHYCFHRGRRSADGEMEIGAFFHDDVAIWPASGPSFESHVRSWVDRTIDSIVKG